MSLRSPVVAVNDDVSGGDSHRREPALDREDTVATQARNHPIDGRILAPAMSRAPNAPAAAVTRQVVQTGSVNFMISPQLPLAQTLSELTSATR